MKDEFPFVFAAAEIGEEDQLMDNEKAEEGQSEKGKREAFDYREISTSTSPQFGNLAHAVR